MRFIIRNLGWILLIIFFVFMLYLISTQNNVKNNIVTNTGSLVNNIIDKKIVSNEVDLKIISKEVEVLDKGENKKTETGSFINSIRNFFTLNKYDNNNNNNNNNDITLVEKNVNIDKKLNMKTKEISDKIQNISDEIIIVDKNIDKTSTGGFLNSIKNIFSFSNDGNNDDLKYDNKFNNDEIVTLTGEVDEELIKKVDSIISKNLKNQEKQNNIIQDYKNNSAGKKIKEVAVKSIFLNNAYFTKRLYTAYKGDKLEQLTNTNKYGCFKVKVISSKDITNNGKVAWTCDYYMKGKINTIKKYIPAAIEYKQNIKNNTSKIYKVNVSALKLNNYNFSKKIGLVYYGDKVKQLTQTNKFGCFKIKVLNSKNKTNNGKIAWACKNYLK